MKILCIGSVSKDIFFPTKEGLIIETPTDLMSQKKIAFEIGAKYQIKDRFEALGGCAANVAVGLARLGIKCECYAKTGDDFLGNWIRKELKKEKVGTSFLQKEKECWSDLSAIIVDEKSGERVIFFNRDANENLVFEILKMRKKINWFFVSALNGQWQKSIDNILNIANKNKIRIAFNPGQKNIQEGIEKILKIIKKTEILFVNKDEGMEIISLLKLKFSKNNLNDEIFLLKSLKSLGPKVVVLTDGKRGAWIQDQNQVIFSFAMEKNPLETTGAGDAFTSGFLAAYLKGKKLVDCVRWGTANSGHSVLFYGAIKGLLYERTMKKKIKKTKVELLK